MKTHQQARVEAAAAKAEEEQARLDAFDPEARRLEQQKIANDAFVMAASTPEGYAKYRAAQADREEASAAKRVEAKREEDEKRAEFDADKERVQAAMAREMMLSPGISTYEAMSRAFTNQPGLYQSNIIR